jgi:hypothetical protein
VGQTNQGVDIENETDPAIAEHGTTRDQVLLLESMAKALDDNFLLANEFIDQQGAGLIARFNDDENAVLRASAVGCGAYVGTQTQYGGLSPADCDHFAATLH